MTVADLITSALKVLGVLAAGETPSPEDQTDALTALNRLVDTWANQRLALYATRRDTYTLTPGKNPHTIGTEGSPDFNATRPVNIPKASIVLASSPNVELPLNVLDETAWQLTQGKSTSGISAYLWPETRYPLTNLWLNPIPVSADTLVLYTPQQIGRFASTSTTFDLPPGYEEALTYNLAKRLAPQYGVSLSQEAQEIAVESLADLKRTNSKPQYMRADGAVLRPGLFNVIAGDRG